MPPQDAHQQLRPGGGGTAVDKRRADNQSAGAPGCERWTRWRAADAVEPEGNVHPPPPPDDPAERTPMAASLSAVLAGALWLAGRAQAAAVASGRAVRAPIRDPAAASSKLVHQRAAAAQSNSGVGGATANNAALDGDGGAGSSIGTRGAPLAPPPPRESAPAGEALEGHAQSGDGCASCIGTDLNHANAVTAF
jgi:hypothetical protein